MDDHRPWLISKLTVIGFLPLLTVSICIFVGRNLFIAMFVMHWVAMIIPILLYTAVMERQAGLKWYASFLLSQTLFRHFGWYLLLFLLGALATISGYILLSCRLTQWDGIGTVDSHIAEYGFQDAPGALLIACAIYFPTVNPIVEEIFWRVFMLREIGRPTFQAFSELSGEEGELLTNESGSEAFQHQGYDQRTWIVPWYMRIYASALYASYHTLIVGLFFGGVLYGTLSFFCLTGLGLLLGHLFLRSSDDQGFYRTVFLHAGIDAGVVISLGDAIGWFSLIH